jgi:nitrate reductase assembly molybdenum cofactor insertion protein NarJ
MIERLSALAKEAKKKKAKATHYVAASFVIIARSLYESLSSQEEQITMSEAKQAVETLAKLLDVLRQLDDSAVQENEAHTFFNELIEKLSSVSSSTESA